MYFLVSNEISRCILILGGQKQYLKKEVLWSAFRVFDKDGDGRITKQELAAILKEQADGEATEHDYTYCFCIVLYFFTCSFFGGVLVELC